MLRIPYTFRSGAFGDEEEKCLFLHYTGEGGVELLLLLVLGSSAQCANDKTEVQRPEKTFPRHTGEVSVGPKLDSPPASCLAIHTALPYDCCFKKGKLISYEKLEKHPGSQLHNRNVPFYLQAEFLFLFLKVFLDVQ